MAVLEVKNLTHAYADLSVLRRINFSIDAGQRWWLSGPNGVGKSTLLNLLAGESRVQSGTIHLHDQDITHWSSTQRSRAGMARSFQIPQLFSSMTISEHWRAVGRANVNDARCPNELAYAERKRLDVDLALARPASVLLLDEPTAGLSANEALQCYADIAKGFPHAAILVVEHEATHIAGFATHVARLHQGELQWHINQAA